jgi:hypothetical protein
MSLLPAQIEAYAAVARAHAAAPRGGKAAVVAQWCEQLGVSRATLLRGLAAVAPKAARKQRTDAGVYSLSREEAVRLSAVLMESLRKNTKQLATVQWALQVLRADAAQRGTLFGARVDMQTGELIEVGEAAALRALRGYELHPEQLLRAAVATELQSLHPNHAWQIDASQCVLYRLQGEGKHAGLHAMRRQEFYKNKPANLARIEQDRVWRYVVTDHYSGAVFVHYVMHAETALNLAEAFIACCQPRLEDGHTTPGGFYGVPLMLMMDKGSANTAGLSRNLFRRLGVQVLEHAAENARATGQVENAQNLVERQFEASLKFTAVTTLLELNGLARRWCHAFNSTRVHSRHAQTRYAVWNTIKPNELRIGPTAELMRELLTHEPQLRKVSDTLLVNFAGREFDVAGVPGVMVGQKLAMSYAPYQPDAAVAVLRDADGHELLVSCPALERTAAGFRPDAPVIGQEWARAPRTTLDTNRAEVERVAMQAATDDEAASKRKAKVVAFGGALDAFGAHAPASSVAYLPRAGTTLALDKTTSVLNTVQAVTSSTGEAISAKQMSTQKPRREAAQAHYNGFELVVELKQRGVELSAAARAALKEWQPEGAHEDELDALVLRLKAFEHGPLLQVVR